MFNQFIILIKNIISSNDSVDINKIVQSAEVVLLFQDYFGGDICYVDDEHRCYYNILDNKLFDWNGKTYNKDKLKFQKREELLDSVDVQNRYNKLKDKYEQECAKVLKIDNDVHKCKKCHNNVEKFGTNNTIHFGNNNDIIILGEAPANNGWRKSGKVWYDQNNKILPSGKVMEKLLEILNLKILDVTFLESVKCYPKERKFLNTCETNCNCILKKQIKVLKPKIILTLGNMATKAILNIKYKNYSEVVGKIYEQNIDGIKTIIIPIYHPSPISPLSYKGNIPIFNKIKELL